VVQRSSRVGRRAGRSVQPLHRRSIPELEQVFGHVPHLPRHTDIARPGDEALRMVPEPRTQCVGRPGCFQASRAALWPSVGRFPEAAASTRAPPSRRPPPSGVRGPVTLFPPGVTEKVTLTFATGSPNPSVALTDGLIATV
jgi:hypothetical protein